MWSDFLTYYFWFVPPSSVLSQADKLLALIFLCLLAAGIACRMSMIFIKNPINRKLLRKIWNFGLIIGLIGIVWVFVRYENTPLFGRRFWAGIDLAVALVWVVFIAKYAIFNFRQEKLDHEREQVKSKYLPKSK